MSATVVARGLAAAHGVRVLFDDLDLTVGPGDVSGLVGPNGAGKSTLLQVLSGSRAADAGTVALAPPDAAVGHLPQEREHTAESVHDHLARRTGVAAAARELDAAAHALADGQTGADDRYATALEHWLALGGSRPG